MYDNVMYGIFFFVWKELYVIFEFNGSIYRDEGKGCVFLNFLFKVIKVEVIFIVWYRVEFEVVVYFDYVIIIGDVEEIKVCIFFL